MGEYEHAMDTIHASVQGSPVALLGVRIPAALSVGRWCALLAAGRLSQAPRDWRMDFLTVLSNHSQKRAGPLSFCPGAYSKRRTQTGGGKPQTHSPHPPLTKHIHTLSLHVTFSV